MYPLFFKLIYIKRSMILHLKQLKDLEIFWDELIIIIK